MNKYGRLMKNTVLFAIGTFSSKVLVFLMMPLYTRVLSDADYGKVDLIVQTGNLLLPIVSLGITNAVIRFGLDRSYRKKDVFSTGVITIFTGFALLLLTTPFLLRFPYIANNTVLLYAFVLMSLLRSLCSQMVRSMGMVRLYTFDGIMSTATTIFFNILYLVGFKWGITGYVLAIASSDCLSALLLFSLAKLGRFVRFRNINRATSRAMLKYSIPLIPTTMLWWITNVSDRYLVTGMIDSAANGLYAVAYKIPTIVILVSGIFMDAWQMSAVTENPLERKQFFSNVFGSFKALIFTAASGLILFAKLGTKILVSEAFYPSWKYIPFLIMSTTYSCLVTFMGSVYMVEKKSVLSLVTSAVGAGTNIVLNLILIPKYGVNGAAFATFVSYLVAFVLRAISARRMIRMEWNVPKLIFDTLVLFAQSIILIKEVPYWLLYEIALTLLMVVTNVKSLLLSAKKILRVKN
ncbi:oligosaccharide flippase family protein [Feifania hominis]|uniref:Oligosaccharide flippase family protein n=1 Tax=Feifania hominis TaxID=2763660 RepID=A0A926DD89_9FIRM|nr:oligosaccharide flippase family protein [Feifania hominis]MBC8535717.1 oligosaccharide flippase family protein [Feifania hominis]